MENNQKKRKYQLPDFRDLFSALFKIKDLNVQNRVLDAINGITADSDTHCGFCGNRKNIKTTDMTTQTNKINLSFVQKNSDDEVEPEYNNKKEETSKFIRKRKRIKKIPRVEKSSPNKPTRELILGKQEKIIKKEAVSKIVDDKEIEIFLEQSNDTLADIFCDLDETKTAEITSNELQCKMQRELLGCLQYMANNQAYLPIHHAIVTNDLRKLMLQKFVLRYRKITLNKLYTKSEYPENALQLAIKANCLPKILIELFEFGGDDLLDDVDYNQNSLLHLAMLYLEHDNTETFKVLMSKINNLQILSDTNENGQTALHIGINLNKPLFCQLLLLKLDEKLNITSKIPKSSIINQNTLLEYYTEQMSSIGIGEIVALNKNKMKIVNAIDLKHGKTPLLFALGKNNRLLVLMLLYNGADPRIKDYSQNDYIETEDKLLQSVLSNTTTYLEKCSQI